MTSRSTRLDSTTWLPGVLALSLAHYAGWWLPTNLRPAVGLVGMLAAAAFLWYWSRTTSGGPPRSYDRSDWLLATAVATATGAILGLLHLRLGRLPEAAATLFITSVVGGWMLWTSVSKYRHSS